MRIAIEAQRIFRKNKHGMDYVVLQEILHLQQIDKENEYFVFVKPGEDRCVRSTDNVHIVELSCPSYPLWEQWALPRAVKKCKAEILHCTSNTAPIHCDVPLILTLHDIIFLEPRDRANKSLYQNLGWYYRHWVVPKILGKCKKIITVSNFEKQNIMSKLGIAESRMAMIYNGYNDWFRPIDREEAIKEVGDSSYFLFFGNTDPKKNTERTLVAYARYLEKSSVKRKLYLADLDDKYIDDILKRNNIENIREKICRFGYIANDKLPYVYNAAFAFLYTSLRESFGIPLLEAMACGTPVITSNTSSMPEIADKESALFVTPTEVDEIADAMLRLESNEKIRTHISEHGKECCKSFSWQQTAEHLLSLYNNVEK